MQKSICLSPNGTKQRSYIAPVTRQWIELFLLWKEVDSPDIEENVILHLHKENKHVAEELLFLPQSLINTEQNEQKLAEADEFVDM
ncbi:hypothetical protein [Aureibacillus halotolerans]|uniref:Uncharacterized protein n=1 Tax=Aureibacillus halotolerans TaxID=1508390 RepID=A0A4R6TTV3_9BACI|nr:hypothetical protein [Aureibacillus halotolerans]TDQ37128.1 hypothetical protein EV213_1147 [Aureibacillus halotolerans]